jgi:hypothetical protein
MAIEIGQRRWGRHCRNGDFIHRQGRFVGCRAQRRRGWWKGKGDLMVVVEREAEIIIKVGPDGGLVRGLVRAKRNCRERKLSLCRTLLATQDRWKREES